MWIWQIVGKKYPSCFGNDFLFIGFWFLHIMPCCMQILESTSQLWFVSGKSKGKIDWEKEKSKKALSLFIEGRSWTSYKFLKKIINLWKFGRLEPKKNDVKSQLRSNWQGLYTAILCNVWWSCSTSEPYKYV